jgi:hypothetical protein
MILGMISSAVHPLTGMTEHRSGGLNSVTPEFEPVLNWFSHDCFLPSLISYKFNHTDWSKGEIKVNPQYFLHG